MATWQVQQAESHFSKLLESAETDGPQTIARDGKERAVVLSFEDYKRLAAPHDEFKEFLLGPPYVDDFLIPESQDKGRKIRL